jgi:hypothetical protein
MQGLGLGLNKSRVNKRYGLDLILGAYNSCVLWFSYYRISYKYNGFCCRIIRESDLSEIDIGFVNGYIDITAIENFCNGTVGRVKVFYNQSYSPNKKNAIQSTLNNMPIIYQSGAFLSDGVKAELNTSMNIQDYSEIQIINPPLSYYLNHSSVNLVDGNIINKGIDPTQTQLYNWIFYSGGFKSVMLYIENEFLTQKCSYNDKVLFNWQDKNINGLKSISSQGSSSRTLNIIVNNYITFDILMTDGNTKTIAIFNSNQYNNYLLLSLVC